MLVAIVAPISTTVRVQKCTPRASKCKAQPLNDKLFIQTLPIIRLSNCGKLEPGLVISVHDGGGWRSAVASMARGAVSSAALAVFSS